MIHRDPLCRFHILFHTNQQWILSIVLFIAGYIKCLYSSVVVQSVPISDGRYQQCVGRDDGEINHILLTILAIVYRCWNEKFNPRKDTNHESLRLYSKRASRFFIVRFYEFGYAGLFIGRWILHTRRKLLVYCSN